MLYHVRIFFWGGGTTSFIARRPTLCVWLSYIANHAHCTPVKCWCPLVCPQCWFFQQQRSDWNNGQSILHLTKTRLYNIYHYDTCQWSRVITHTGSQIPFKINSIPIKGCYYEEIFTWGVCEWTLLKIEFITDIHTYNLSLYNFAPPPPPPLQKEGHTALHYETCRSLSHTLWNC